MTGTATLPEDQKIFSMQELKSKGFSQYKVSKLVSEGKLIKLNKSYYENAEYRGEESDFYYTEAYAPKGVICLLSAAVYYHLTTFVPDAVDVAIPRKAATIIQKSAPGPPAHTAVATPTIFPVPIVALNAVHSAAKLLISPSPSSSF